jgi:hypothetical protein
MVGILSVSVCGATWAATIIERQEMGKTKTITLDRQHVRIDSSDPNFYIIMDLNRGESYMVNAKERRIVKIKVVGTPPSPPQDEPPWGRRSQPSRDTSKNQPIKAKLLKIGNGSRIAGYPTVNYEIKANNKVCSKNYFSKQAANVPYIMDFINAISRMSSSRRIKGMPLPPCFQAYNDLETEYMKLGMPMKTVVKGKKGNIVMYEITRIQTNVNVPSNIFRLPNYQIISEQQMIKESQAKMEKWRREAEQAGKQHQYNRPPQQQDRNDYRRRDYNKPPQSYRNRDYNRPPQDYRSGDYNRPPQDYRSGDYNNSPSYDPSMIPPR